MVLKKGRLAMATIRTLRRIAERMGWKSPSTVMRRHKLDGFPLYFDWTKRGLIWVTSDELIGEWERHKVEAAKYGPRIKTPWKWRRHRPSYQSYDWQLKKRTDNGTKLPSQTQGKGPPSVRARECPPPPRRLDPAPAPKNCTCGTPVDCHAHD